MHVVVYCGYEGIDRVLWAGEEGAREACLRIRQRIADNLKQVNLPSEPEMSDYEDVEDWHVAIDKWYKLRNEAWSAVGPWFWERMEDPGRVCAMKEVGEFEYDCCCEELGVGTGESWLY